MLDMEHKEITDKINTELDALFAKEPMFQTHWWNPFDKMWIPYTVSSSLRPNRPEVDRDDRIRTCDLLDPIQALYQAKLRPG